VLTLSQADSGSRHAVTVGDRIRVELAENPTTGYRWQIDVDASKARVVDDEFRSDSDATGAPGRRILTFEVLQPGEIDLRLRCARSWELKNPQREFDVTLQATAAT
jgi:inhibitor of cysteine peptidase